MYRLDLQCFSPPFAFAPADFERYLTASNIVAILAMFEAEVAGFVVLSLTRRLQRTFAYIATLDIHPDHRRIGLASLLMQHAEHTTVVRAASSISLHVWTENHPAIAFYERSGYRRLRLVEHYYATGRDAWLYRKPLTATDA